MPRTYPIIFRFFDTGYSCSYSILKTKKGTIRLAEIITSKLIDNLSKTKSIKTTVKIEIAIIIPAKSS